LLPPADKGSIPLGVEPGCILFPINSALKENAEMDDFAGIIVMVLVGILAIFMIVRLVKSASRTVDEEQKKNGASVKEVTLGMTLARVELELGLPETKVDLGEKVLYKYKNMTVEFHNGRVTDVR
jgi:hypothetical protein